MTNVAIIGTGYVGLVTGVVLSEIGHTVICIDIDKNKVNTLKSGKSPIYEPGLDKLIVKNIEANRLFFTTNHNEAFENSAVVFIAVGTPQSDNGAADLTYVKQAAKDIALNIVNDTIVVVKSTVPVGTNDVIESIIQEHLNVDVNVDVVSNPEFLREGHAIHDTFHGDRIVIGAEEVGIGDSVEALFKPLNLPILRTNRRSAEMIKYASNAFLATKISFINEIANLCEKVRANVLEVADGMGMDQRIGREFLNAGLGYGGSCFPKDTEALSYLAKENNVDLNIVEATIQANHDQRQLFVEKVLKYFDGNVEGKKIAILGLAFKPNTDDMRESPSEYIIEQLNNKGAVISVYDPVIKSTQLLDKLKIKVSESIEETVLHADTIVLVTEWDDFKLANWTKIGELVKRRILFDGRNVLDSHEEIKHNWLYKGVGL